jgi:hypothetical protein
VSILNDSVVVAMGDPIALVFEPSNVSAGGPKKGTALLGLILLNLLGATPAASPLSKDAAPWTPAVPGDISSMIDGRLLTAATGGDVGLGGGDAGASGCGGAGLFAALPVVGGKA